MKGPRLWSQTRMPEAIVPLPEKREVFDSFADMFDSEFVEPEWKINFLWTVAQLETLNGITKKDLHAAIRWLIDTYEF